MRSELGLRALLAVLFLCLFTAPGCVVARSDENEPLDPEIVRRLVPGRTTSKQVVELLGAPNDVVQLAKRTAYRYDHRRQKGAGLILIVLNFANLDARTDRMWLFFDENQVLSHFGATFASHHTQYAMPWEDVHEAEDNAARDEDRPSMIPTSKDEPKK
jgi:hypothetical protein